MTTFTNNILWMRMRFLLSLLLVIALWQCSKGQRDALVQEPEPNRIELETWKPYNWQEKVLYFDTMKTFRQLNEADYKILLCGLYCVPLSEDNDIARLLSAIAKSSCTNFML